MPRRNRRLNYTDVTVNICTHVGAYSNKQTNKQTILTETTDVIRKSQRLIV